MGIGNNYKQPKEDAVSRNVHITNSNYDWETFILQQCLENKQIGFHQTHKYECPMEL